MGEEYLKVLLRNDEVLRGGSLFFKGTFEYFFKVNMKQSNFYCIIGFLFFWF